MTHLGTFRLIMCTICLLVGLLMGCSHPPPKRLACTQTKELELYVGNISTADTLVRARVVLDDSLLDDRLFVTPRLSSEKRTGVLRICPGTHRLQVQFGQFRKDTALVIAGDQSLFISYDYETYEGAVNGIAVALLNHDYNWYHRID
ncbi:hypothetical protein [Hymenobacter frigidus]|nr:hypothetical protein [Hymenobacter frigidus]